jgi:hypothetical protein
MRTAIWAAAGCAAMLLAGCASQAAGADSTGSRAITTARVAQSPEQLAEAAAVSMLAAFRPPSSAVRSGPIAVQVLSAPPEQSATSDRVLRTEWWRADGTPSAVLTWIRGHQANEFTLGGSGASGGPAADEMQFDQFVLPSVPGVLPVRWLLVTVAQDQAADRAAIRVDSEVSWEPPKPAGERIPADAKVVTITPIAGYQPLPAGDRPDTVTNPAEVAKIVAAVDGLPLFPPGAFHCPADFGRSMLLTFRATRSGPALAEATSQTGGCGAVTLTIKGRAMPTLWHGPQLEQQVMGIAGIRWPGFFSY